MEPLLVVSVCNSQHGNSGFARRGSGRIRVIQCYIRDSAMSETHCMAVKDVLLKHIEPSNIQFHAHSFD